METFYVENMIQEFDSLLLISVALMTLVKMAVITMILIMTNILDAYVSHLG